MLGLHPNILEKDGKREFAILPYEEFAQIQEELIDYEDLKELRLAKEEEKYSLTISFEEARKEFGLY
ncbi:MAG: type II toxin-antitoxin system Phd/YefM family antitoxin [Candidatus Desantisbacteria bacterium]